MVASFYPLAYAATQIGGAHVAVTNLTAPGVEPHDLELSPRDVDKVEDAKLVIVLGQGFQPAVERVAKRNANTVALFEKLGVRGDDPHVWLDPVVMATIVDEVAAALQKLDPGNAAAYATNAARLRERITALDGRYRAGLANCQRHEIVTAHEAFGRMSARYGLTQKAVAGLSPESEPNPAKLAELADLITRDGVTTIFTEELVSPKVADALAREAHVHTAVLNPLEGLTKDQAARGDDYVSVMDANLKILQTALACN